MEAVRFPVLIQLQCHCDESQENRNTAPSARSFFGTDRTDTCPSTQQNKLLYTEIVEIGNSVPPIVLSKSTSSHLLQAVGKKSEKKIGNVVFHSADTLDGRRLAGRITMLHHVFYDSQTEWTKVPCRYPSIRYFYEPTKTLACTGWPCIVVRQKG